MMLNDVTKDILKTAAGVAIGMTTVIAVNSMIDVIGNVIENRNKKKEEAVVVEVKEPNTQETKDTEKEEKKEESKK